MIYGTDNYAERERAAWQRGDYELAEVLAQLDTAESSEAIVDDLREKLENVREHITAANWRTGTKADLRVLIEQIVNELAAA